MTQFDDLNKQFDVLKKLNLSGLTGISQAILQQQKLLSQIGTIPIPSQDVLDAIARIDLFPRPSQGMLDAIAASQDVFRRVEASHLQLAASLDWPKLLETTTRAQAAFLAAEPFRDFYASQGKRLADIALTQMQAAATIAVDSPTWAGVAALEAELEVLAGDAPTGQVSIVIRLIIWSIAVSLFMKLVGDGLVHGGADEALVYAATLAVWLERAWHFYLADSGEK